MNVPYSVRWSVTPLALPLNADKGQHMTEDSTEMCGNGEALPSCPGFVQEETVQEAR